MNLELTNYLSDFISERRLALFNRIIKSRTRYITIALEDIYQPHNASAVLRSCDCFGVQDVHIIENKNKYNVNPDVALGSSKWINLIKHNTEEDNTLSTIKHLKQEGYRIVATTPHTNDTELNDFDLTKGKTALFFGTEMRGLSKTMLDNADEFLKINMQGFTESLNISVSAAIVLHHLTLKLRNSEIPWSLTDTEVTDIKLNWLRNTINKPELIEKRFFDSLK